MNKNILLTIILVILVVVTAVQAVELTSLKNKLETSKMSAAKYSAPSTGSQQKSLSSLPQQVGGC